MSEIKFAPLTEVLKLRLQADTLPTLSDAIAPTIVLENDRPEYLHPQGALICMQNQTVTITNSTNHIAVGLINPTDEILVLVEGIWGSWWVQDRSALDLLGAPVIRQVSTADLPNLHLADNMRDQRWNVGGGRRGMAQFRSQPGVAAAVGSPLGITMCTAVFIATGADNDAKVDWIVPLARPFVLGAAGQGIAIDHSHSVVAAGVDMILAVCIAWSERKASSWERSSVR